MKTRLLYVLLAALALGVAPDYSRGAVQNYSGMCDASAAVALNHDLLAVADDEDNVLRVYSRERGGAPVYSTNLSPFLKIGRRAPEADLEGATRLGNRIYWITSHGANKNGKFQINRHRLFATTGSVSNGIIDLKPTGRPYPNLLNDLAADPRLAAYHLPAAALRRPKSEDALNIEGLAATPEGHLLIGFRNPVPAGRALIVPLLNPGEVIEGRSARFGDPLHLDLGGRGVRSIEFSQGRYLIVAGSVGLGGESQLFEWLGGGDQPRPLVQPELADINPEAIAVFDDDSGEWLWVASDDGTVQVGGLDCKLLKDPSRKGFRAVSFDLSITPSLRSSALTTAAARRALPCCGATH